MNRLLGFLLVAAGITGIAFGMNEFLWNEGIESRPIVEGQVLRCESTWTTRKTGASYTKTYEVKLSYNYDVDGKDYKSSRIHGFREVANFPTKDLADAFAEPFEEGATVNVRYVRDQPEDATLFKGSNDLIVILLLGSGVVVVCGFLMLLLTRKRKYQPRVEEQVERASPIVVK